MITNKKGNLLESNCDYICHQVNCMGKMGSGIAGQIKAKWPKVYSYYRQKCLGDPSGYMRPELLLGNIQIVALYDYETEKNKRHVINMFAQQHYGYDGRRYTSYDAFWSCLGKIKDTVPKGSKIGFPRGIGCGLGGANWNVIFEMINEVLGKDYEVFVYYLEDNDNE